MSIHPLPKANPVCEQIPASRIVVPDLQQEKLVELLEEAGGLVTLLDADKTDSFLRMVEQDALLIDTPEHINEMITLMKTEISGHHAA